MKATEETDKQLVSRVQKGDKRAFDLLVLKYQHRVASLVGRYVRDTDEVLDVTQEVFVKAYRALPNFRGDSAFYTWLYRVAINTAKNYLVSRSRRVPTTDIDLSDGEFLADSAVIDDSAAPENALMETQLRRVISSAMDGLPEDLRVALTLREFEGLSYDEIAAVMECPLGTVRSRIFRAREAVEAALAEMG